MSKGLDYVISLKDGDFGGAAKARNAILGIDTAVAETEGKLGGLRSILGEVGSAILGVFAVEKVWEFGKESLHTFRETEMAAAQVNAGIKSTAGIAGQSLDELREKAEALEHKTLFTEAQTLNADAMLLTFTNIRGKIFDEAIPAIEDMATRMGGNGPEDLKGAALQVGKALQDPITGIGALHRIGVAFNDQQKQQIASLVKHGQVAEADAIILKELNTEFGGSAAAARSVLGPSADLNVEIEEMRKGFGKLIGEGLSVAVPLILEIIEGVKETGHAMAEAYHWVKENKDIFVALGIAVGGAALGFVAANPSIIAFGIEAGVTAIASGALAVAQGVLTAATWALNVAMAANPIGLIITAIGLLTAGIYEAYQRSETFRSVLAGIGEIGTELMPVFKGLGEIILGAFTLDVKTIKQGFNDAVKGVQGFVNNGGVKGAFTRGAEHSLAESHKADEAEKKRQADEQKGHSVTSANGLLPHKKDAPYSITTGGRGTGKGTGEGATLAGGRQVRNVQVSIGKLVERLEVHTTNLSGVSSGDIKRQVTELLTGAVHDSELALGSQ
jgi:hypothetical protein